MGPVPPRAVIDTSSRSTTRKVMVTTVVYRRAHRHVPWAQTHDERSTRCSYCTTPASGSM